MLVQSCFLILKKKENFATIFFQKMRLVRKFPFVTKVCCYREELRHDVSQDYDGLRFGLYFED